MNSDDLKSETTPNPTPLSNSFPVLSSVLDPATDPLIPLVHGKALHQMTEQELREHVVKIRLNRQNFQVFKHSIEEHEKEIKEPKVKIKKAEVLDFGLDDEEADETPELKFDL